MTIIVPDIFIPRHEQEGLSGEHIRIKSGDRLEGRVVEIRNDGKAVLDFEKFQAVVELKVPIEKGEAVIVVVEETGKGKPVKLRLEDILFHVKKENLTGAPKIISPVETIPGGVAQIFQPQSRPRAQTGQRLHREIATPMREEFPAGKELSEDTTLLFENIKMALKQMHSNSRPAQPHEAPPAVKSIFAGLSKLSGVIRDTLAAYPDDLPLELRQLLTTLNSHCEPLDLNEPVLKLVPKLKTLVEDSGIFFEKKIQDMSGRLNAAPTPMNNSKNPDMLPGTRDIIANDLKPNLLLLREYFDSDKFPARFGRLENFEMIKNAVEDLLTNINNEQGRAVEAELHRQPVLAFSFQIPLKGGAEAQLKVFYQKKRQKKEEKQFKLSLLLNMDKLGEIRTDFSQREKKINITFFVKNNKIKEFIESRLNDIKEPLGADFKTSYLKVLVSPKKIETFSAALGEPGIISDRAVDIKV